MANKGNKNPAKNPTKNLIILVLVLLAGMAPLYGENPPPTEPAKATVNENTDETTNDNTSETMEEPKQIQRDIILKTEKEWQDIYDGHQVDTGMLEALLGKVEEGLRIDLYLALWCGDSKRNVPVFLKILDALAQQVGSSLPVSYYTVERKPNDQVKYFVESLHVERVPTFIFYRDGAEIGRIVENPRGTLLEDFIEIVF